MEECQEELRISDAQIGHILNHVQREHVQFKRRGLLIKSLHYSEHLFSMCQLFAHILTTW